MSEQPGVLQYATPEQLPAAVDRSSTEKLAHGFLGEWVPIAALFICTIFYRASEPLYTPWLNSLDRLLTFRCGWPFLPLVVFSWFGHFHMLFGEDESVRRRQWQMAVYTGTILALQYIFVCAIGFGPPVGRGLKNDITMAAIYAGISIVTAIGGSSVFILSRIIAKRFDPRHYVPLTFTAYVIILILLVAISGNVFPAILLPLAFCIAFAPVLALSSFLLLSLDAYRHTSITLDDRAWFRTAWLCWIAIYAVAWIAAIKMMSIG